MHERTKRNCSAGKAPVAKLGSSIFWLFAAILFFAHAARSAGEDLIARPVDSALLYALPHHAAAWTTASNDAGEMPSDVHLSRLTLVLEGSAQQQVEYDEFLRQQQDPDSPNYHHWLTPIEIGDRFGASSHDIDAITGWLVSQGLHVDAVANSRMRINFSGSAGNVAAAFSTRLHTFLVNGEERIAPIAVPQIPAALSAVVQSVRGLVTIDERPRYGIGATLVAAETTATEQPGATVCSGTNCVHYLFPADFAEIYDVNPVYQQGITGSGQTIAIIGRGRPYLPDIENFQSRSGLPVKDPVIILPPGGTDPGAALSTGGNPSGDQVEATIDVVRATSVAPGATIDLVISAKTATSSGVDIASHYVVDTSPVFAQIMSMSYTACESDAGPASVQFWDSLFKQAAAEGISVFVISGDAGAAGCDGYFAAPPAIQIASTSETCASSFATCVGGTQFADSADPSAHWSSSNGVGFESAAGYIPEGAWNEPLDSSGNAQAAATGGGVSMYAPTPYWQTGVGVPGTQGRYSPDVSFSAAHHDGYFACLAALGASCVPDMTGRFATLTIYGTSATAPSMAGIAALLNQRMGGAQGNLNPRLYALAAAPGNGVFHDVTISTSGVSGCDPSVPSMCNNSTPGTAALSGGLKGYTVGPGYDLATGLGSIDVANLLTQWNFGAAAANYQGLWWNAAESGWGVNFAHQGDQIFATWYTYDASGNPWWLSMLASRNPLGSNTYTGPIYVDTGPPFNNFVGSGLPTQVGIGSLAFADVNTGLFSYTVTAGGGFNVQQTKPITRFNLGGALPTCAYSANSDLNAATNYQDLWWVSTESGWGVNFAHQRNLVYATWYTYGANGAPLWLSALLTQQGATNVYTGPLNRTSGPRFDSYRTSDEAPVQTIGTATATFADGDHASFAYSTNGSGGLPLASQSKSISRFLFAAPAATECH